jgi:hypothetical protein
VSATVGEYPLIFTLTFDIRCSEFAARVVSHGRALMAAEDGEWWCHGVDPGGLTASGDNPAVAFSAFKQTFHEILLEDIAQEAGSFERFKRSVEAFVADTDNNEAARWQKAREEIRAGTPVDGPFSELQRVTDTGEATVVVMSLDRVSAGGDQVGLASARAA